MKMTKEIEAAWHKTIAKAWEDPKFKRALQDDPNKVLAANGVSIPAGVNVVVVENEPNRLHLVLPAKPGGDVSVGKLDRAAVSDYDPGF